MGDQNLKDRKPDPERLKVFRNLPKHIVENFTKEETRSFLQDDEWPDSLREKLKDYIVEES